MVSEKLVKELRDFNHNEAADHIEFLEQQLASLREDFKDAQAEAWDEGTNVPRDFCGDILESNPYLDELQYRFRTQEETRAAAIQELVELEW